MRRLRLFLSKIYAKGFIGLYKYFCYRLENQEKRCSYGNLHPNKIFYVIRSINDSSKFYEGVKLNLLANYSYVISHIMYANKKGYIPVIDQKNYPVYNKENFIVNGTDNPWEYFWVQPFGINLEEVYKSQNVILSNRSWYQPGNPQYSIESHKNIDSINKYNRLMQLVPLNDSIKDHIDNVTDLIFGNKKRILGVSMRTNGHSKNSCFHAPGHPIQPTVDELIQVVRQKISSWDADYVFLATEQEDNIEDFRDAFGDKLIVYPRKRYQGLKSRGEMNSSVLYKNGSKYQTSLDYLTEMELLSRCDFLIGSITSGLRYAIFKNGGKFKHLEVLDYGCFPYPKKGAK